MRVCGLLFACLALACPGVGSETAHKPKPTTTMTIPLIERMPRFPSPYHLRDWAKVTRDYVNFVLDPHKSGEFLPLFRPHGENKDAFILPSYVGRNE